MPSDGSWTITVWDLVGADTGTLERWSLHLTPPASPPTVYWSGLPIPDDNEVGLSRTITVPDSFTLADVDIDVMIDHTYIGDLVIEIEHLGTTVTLWDHNCGSNDDMDVIFDDEGNTVECDSPTVGNIIPEGSLWLFDGMDAAGDWTITVRDPWPGFTGSLVRWSLHLDKPATAGDPTVYWGDTGLPIPDDDPGGVSHTINVPDACTIADVNIDVMIEHTFIYDLVIKIEHLGKTVVVWNQNCWSEDDIDVVFDDEGSAVVCASPTVGNVIPFEALSFFDGDNAAGDWIITVSDHWGADTGTLVRWSVHIEPTVGSPRVYLGGPGVIPDSNGVGVSHTIDVPDSFSLGDVDVDVMIEHTYIWDLVIEVEHLGTTVILWAQECGNYDDMDVIFDDEGNTVECNSPTVGNILPLEALSAFDGMDSAGQWTITVRDLFSPDIGTLVRWSLHLDGLGPCSEPPVQAEMKFTPQALNTCSGDGSAKAHFVLPDMYDPCDIADWLPARLRLLDMETLSEQIRVIAGRKKTDLNKIMFTFDRAPFCTLETDEPYADVTVYGWLTSGQPFMGTDTIKIITNPQQFLAVLGSYWLSPDCGEADSCNEFDLNGDSVVNFADFAIQQNCFAPVAELEHPK
jgi:subtilisin-like proprotein convertase family protein